MIIIFHRQIRRTWLTLKLLSTGHILFFENLNKVIAIHFLKKLPDGSYLLLELRLNICWFIVLMHSNGSSSSSFKCDLYSRGSYLTVPKRKREDEMHLLKYTRTEQMRRGDLPDNCDLFLFPPSRHVCRRRRLSMMNVFISFHSMCSSFTSSHERQPSSSYHAARKRRNGAIFELALSTSREEGGS